MIIKYYNEEHSLQPTQLDYFNSVGIHDYLEYNLSGYKPETNPSQPNNTFTNEYVEYQLTNEVTHNDSRS